MTAVRALLLLAAFAPAADPDAADVKDVSSVGFPAGEVDSGARGRFFRVSTEATPTTLQAEEILTLTVRITTNEVPQRPPRRLDLAEYAVFAERFYLLDGDELPPEILATTSLTALAATPGGFAPLATATALAPQTEWVFVYRLKPKSTDVRDVPILTFAYYDPVTQRDTPELRWHVPYAPSIPLEVKTREAVVAPLVAPDWAFRFWGGPDLLDRQRPWSPGVASLALALVVPPLAAGAWYAVWRRRNPDALRQARVRRSRAAARALDALERARRIDGTQRGDLVAEAVAGYLRERFDFPAAEPTPAEVRAHLLRLDLPRTISESASRFFESADAARFPPPPRGDGNVADSAVRLVLALEETSNVPGTRALGFWLIPLLLAALASAETPAESDAALAALAESSFTEGVRLREDREKAVDHFRTAAQDLDELRRRGVHNPALYRDLGNAELLADDVGRAVFAYRAGLRLAPNDSELRLGLAEARRRVVHSPADPRFGRPPESRRPDWLPHVSTAWLFIGSVLAYSAMWLLLARWLMTRRSRPRTLAFVALGLSIVIGFFAVDAVRAERAESTHPAVMIVEDGVLLWKGTNDAFGPRHDTPLSPGVEARLLHERDGWLQIELSGGEVGWIRTAYAVVDR
jgi:hypothetical protein